MVVNRPCPQPGSPKPSLMRNLGAFFGHIAQGVRTPIEPAKPQPRVVREQVQEQEVHTPDGKIVLRRRVIDEVLPGGEAGR